MTKILLVQVNNHPQEAPGLPSLGLGCIAGYLRSHHPEIEIKIINDLAVEEEIDHFRPDLIGMDSYSASYERCRQVAQYARKQSAKVVIGGVHISMLPASLDPAMEVGVIGEGEQTFTDLVELSQEMKWNPTAWSTVPGVVFRDQFGELVSTPPRPLITPLDQLPHPARDLLPGGSSFSAHMLTARGCPYRCRFCASAHFWQKVRYFSPEYITGEINEMLTTRPDLRWLFFYDDLFTLNTDRLERIVERATGLGLPPDLRCVVNVRSDVLTPKIARLLKCMQVSLAFIGMESGSARILSWLKTGDIHPETHRKALSILHEADISVCGSFIVGVPGETEEDLRATYQFIASSGVDLVNLHILTPYPGTPIWDEAVAEGQVDPHMDWNTLSTQGKNLDSRVFLNRAMPLKEFEENWQGLVSLSQSLKAKFDPNNLPDV